MTTAGEVYPSLIFFAITQENDTRRTRTSPRQVRARIPLGMRLWLELHASRESASTSA
jgi:hypothetical protein